VLLLLWLLFWNRKGGTVGRNCISGKSIVFVTFVVVIVVVVVVVVVVCVVVVVVVVLESERWDFRKKLYIW
jgi:hypothetical protein